MKYDENGKAILYYDREGKPMSLEAWAAVFDDMSYRTIGSEMLGSVHISTVWLGTDMSFAEDTSPRGIFETMIFGGDFDTEQCRYDTEEQARAGHEEAVRLVREGCSAAAFTMAFQKFIDGQK